ncbi:ExeM/NucH family extracellular endonuclease [Nocardioides mesophilus]|uniref:ExeM/NucH family extracellular endonuclease n=1 Tax=Nocardioides mesophilus TaxID=433659 RepID=A0A7G9R9G9_9ACTN|nr:ExeM/NucH family extracellular endonuclease [Nocardioides mesophilus]QNN52244.1 ExeM/NucH family extracellular endonuclease [Nocardioides mesophilus]
MRSLSGPRSPRATGLLLTLTTALIGSTVALAPSAQADPAGTGLVLNEVYGGGGNSVATYRNDFVEILNPTSAAIDLGGLSVQYRSATGTTNPSGVVALADVELPGGASYLLQLASSDTTVGAPLPATPDQTDTGVNLSGSTGTVLLVAGTSAYNPGTGDQAGDTGLVDLVGYGASNTFENARADAGPAPAPSNTSSISRTGGADSDDNSTDFTRLSGTAMTPTACGAACTAPPPQPPVELSVAEIQGDGATSPVAGDTVTTTGVVTATYAEGGFRGFYLQTGGTGQTLDGSSDALFVWGSSTVAAMDAGLARGDSVKVTGTVSEFGGLTELTPGSAADIVELAEPLAPVTPALTGWPGTDAAREALEGMLVAPAGDFTVSDNYALNQYGEIGIAQGDEPLYQPTDVAPFGSAEADAVAAHNQAAFVTLDDGASTNFLYSDAGEDTPLPWLTDDPTIRVGEPVTFTRPVVVDYRFGQWRLQPTDQLTAGDTNGVRPATFGDTRTARPADVGGDLQVASFNVLNYFTDLGVDLAGCTFYYDRTEQDPVTVNRGCDARGAAEAEDFERQQAKIVTAINSLGAEVVSLEEIENSAKFGHDRDASLAALVQALNADAGADVWAYVPTPTVRPDASTEDFIRTAFIYKPAAVRAEGESVIRIKDGAEDPFVNARDPLAQVFAPVGATRTDRFMLVVNHLKSKGSAPKDASDPNAEHGQGAWNPRRVEQVRAMTAWVQQLQADRDVAKVYLDGDFNSYTYEDPMLALDEEGYTDLGVRFDAGHTYLFGGLIGSLDHGLANDAALASTTGAAVWNINSVESVALEYSRFNYNATDFYDGSTPYRASDHDPILFGIDTTPAATFEVTVRPEKIKADKTRAKVTVGISQSGVPAEEGTVTVSDGDRLLATATVSEGTARLRLPEFADAGTKELTLSYTDAAGHESTTPLSVVVVVG